MRQIREIKLKIRVCHSFLPVEPLPHIHSYRETYPQDRGCPAQDFSLLGYRCHQGQGNSWMEPDACKGFVTDDWKEVIRLMMTPRTSWMLGTCSAEGHLLGWGDERYWVLLPLCSLGWTTCRAVAGRGAFFLFAQRHYGLATARSSPISQPCLPAPHRRKEPQGAGAKNVEEKA